MEKDLTKVKIFQSFFLGGGYFFETPYIMPAVNSLRSLYTGVCEGRGPFSLAL